MWHADFQAIVTYTEHVIVGAFLQLHETQESGVQWFAQQLSSLEEWWAVALKCLE